MPFMAYTVRGVHLVKSALEVGSAPVRPHDGGPTVQQHPLVVVQRRCSSLQVRFTSSGMAGRSLCPVAVWKVWRQRLLKHHGLGDTPPWAGSMALLSQQM